MIFLLLNTTWYYTYAFLSVITWICTGYVYYLNSKLPVDDPKKKDFSRAAIIAAPITAPLLVLFLISLFILKAILYSIFLIFFTLALLVIRKPFILILLDKIAKKIGNILLEAATFFIRLFFNPRIGYPQHP